MTDNSQLLNELRIERSDQSQSAPPSRWWITAVGLLGLAVAAGWWLTRSPALAVSLVQGQPTTLNGAQRSSVLDASGYVTARRRATVSSKVTGKVVEVLVEEGMVVVEGQLLARLDATLDQAQYDLNVARMQRARVALEEIRVQLAEARRQDQRTKELTARGLASESAADATRAQLETLQARLATGQQDVAVAEQGLVLDRQRLLDNEIRAPFAGVVIAKAAQPGEMISPISAGGGFTRTGICTIVDMDSLEVEVDVNEAYINRVSAEQKVTALLDAYPDWQIPARVIAIIPTADRQKATVRVRIAFEDSDPRILPDMGIRVAFLDIPQADSSAAAINGLAVPASAVRVADGRQYVFVVNDGVARRRAVATIAMASDQVLIRSGVQPGEQMIDNPPSELTDGAAVKPGNSS